MRTLIIGMTVCGIVLLGLIASTARAQDQACLDACRDNYQAKSNKCIERSTEQEKCSNQYLLRFTLCRQRCALPAATPETPAEEAPEVQPTAPQETVPGGE